MDMDGEEGEAPREDNSWGHAGEHTSHVSLAALIDRATRKRTIGLHRRSASPLSQPPSGHLRRRRRPGLHFLPRPAWPGTLPGLYKPDVPASQADRSHRLGSSSQL
jgi:hypothetical protein